MVVSTATAFLVLRRLPVNAAADAPGVAVEVSGQLGLGEQAIALVRRHGVVSCLSVAVGSAALAMTHAEATVGGALPWGAVQALAVVLGFTVLGPRLGLRPEPTSVAAVGG